MLKTLALTVTLLMGLVSNAFADQPQLKTVTQDEWIKWTKDAIVALENGVKNLHWYRDDACPKVSPASRVAVCNASYNAIISRRQNEMAHLQLWLRAEQAGPEIKNRILNDIATVEEFNRMESLTTSMWGKVWTMFPASQQKK